MSPLMGKCPREMSKAEAGNVQEGMSKDVPELTDDELALPLEPYERQLTKDKKTDVGRRL